MTTNLSWGKQCWQKSSNEIWFPKNTEAKRNNFLGSEQNNYQGKQWHIS